jgi:hypothetical protein
MSHGPGKRDTSHCLDASLCWSFSEGYPLLQSAAIPDIYLTLKLKIMDEMKNCKFRRITSERQFHARKRHAAMTYHD